MHETKLPNILKIKINREILSVEPIVAVPMDGISRLNRITICQRATGLQRLFTEMHRSFMDDRRKSTGVPPSPLRFPSQNA